MEQHHTSSSGSMPRDQPSEPASASSLAEPAGTPVQPAGAFTSMTNDAPEQPAAMPVLAAASVHSADPDPLLPARAGASDTPALVLPALPDQPSVRRGLVYLALCVAFALALIVPNLFGASARSRPPAPCDKGAVLAQVLAGDGRSGAAPFLLAVVRPQPFPNVAPGNEPGCDALYRSTDGGITWTLSFSATAEAPAAVALLPASDQVYLLTLRMHFPLYLAGNIYRSDHQAAAWTWNRVSPQGRHDVPMVSALDLSIMDDGSLILREGNGDGAALVTSRDGGATWQPLPIPQPGGVGSVATIRDQIAITLPLLVPGRSPGMISGDHGMSWRAMAPLPHAPPRADLRPLLSVDTPEGALVLDLVPDGVVGPGGTVARYYSLDAGRHWTRTHCGGEPAPGCAVAARWTQAAGMRYVLYHARVFQAPLHGSWTPLAPLPIASDSVLQLLAVADGHRPLLYLIAATAIWRWDGHAWERVTTGLPLGSPAPSSS